MSAEISSSKFYFWKSCEDAAEHVASLTWSCRRIVDVTEWAFPATVGQLLLNWQPTSSISLGKLLKPLSMFCPVGTGKRGIHYHRVNRRGDN